MPQTSEKSLERAVETGTLRALKSIEARYEYASEARDNLPFHNRAHTEGVVRRTKIILTAIGLGNPNLINGRDIQIGQLAAAYHDTVQGYELAPTNEGAFTKLQRKRFTTQNEKASAGEALEYMHHVGPVFKEKDARAVREAIEATIPEFNPELKTVMQPNVTNNSSLVARAVALADLGVAGMDGPDAYLPEGDALFREENLDIEAVFTDKVDISPEQKEYFRGRMLAWCNFQPKFAEGRKALLDSEIAAIPMPARENVKALFNKFDETIAASSAKAKERSSMTFEQLARDMCYKI